ncbi:hypothetical protein [Rathayibacter sp. AY1D5]|uniref:hypothetical protein n=1 Tax=Rathayibacter sp. AY1D5 TaxID=2080546 RepID=UPI0011AFEC14|nr:hypothetical protein [Rathayibacter sp. AY1D5]
MQRASADQSFVEFREVTVSDPLRQGDILEATEVGASKWQRNLFVLTADCDFANAKNQGRVTCVPLLTQDEYILEFQIPRIRRRLLPRLTENFQAIIAKSSDRTISTDRLTSWPLEEETDTILGALDIDLASIETARLVIDAIREISVPHDTLDTAVQHLVSAHAAIPNGKSPANAKKDILATVQSHYSSPPGDALFLSAIAPAMQDGYFLYLRHLEQVPESQIALGPMRTSSSYRRIARLHDRFTHAVAQQFALVFMAIGLPSEYEEMRNLHAELLGERYK